eukprot:TRINITY_DN8879_c0_g1_i1.p1 TRINITY_DN8879_c0_g1~~TRINITY_DN8879_c0_g1_i1.p1  ORF type:complete len:678 (-),score=175.40 TRINITY_DN8879_c0_g1_i1:84-2117(-)
MTSPSSSRFGDDGSPKPLNDKTLEFCSYIVSDSPKLQEEIKRLETRSNTFKTNIEAAIAASKKYTKTGIAHREAGVAVGTAIQNLIMSAFNQEDDTTDAPPIPLAPLKQFASMFKELESLKEMMYFNMENLLALPLSELGLAEKEEIKSARKTYSSATKRFHQANNKLRENVFAKKASAKAIEQAKEEICVHKRTFDLASFDYANKINEVHAGKTVSALEQICTFVYAQLSYFTKCVDLIHNLEPSLKSVMESLQERYKYLANGKGFAEERRKLLQEHAQSYTTYAVEDIFLKKNGEKQGYLYKKSKSFPNEWKKRLFCLQNNRLVYYRSIKESNPMGAIPLELTCVRDAIDPDNDRVNAFEIYGPSNHHLLSADSEKEKNDWMNLLRAVSTRFLVEEKSNYTKNNSTTKKPVKDQAALLAVQKELSNLTCADCSARDPDWVSINLGVVVCIECSGIHRGLGRHISKVRSLTLDRWEPELLQFLRTIGNAKMNEIWEGSLPKNFVKPQPKDPRQVKEKFIQQKYTFKEFLLRDTQNSIEMATKLYSAAVQNDVYKLVHMLYQDCPIVWANPEELNRTAPHAAVDKANYVCISLLLANGADVNAKDISLRTPLHYAASNQNAHGLLILLNAGASIDEKDSEGLTAIDLAASGDQNPTECEAILLEYRLAHFEKLAENS